MVFLFYFFIYVLRREKKYFLLIVLQTRKNFSLHGVLKYACVEMHSNQTLHICKGRLNNLVVKQGGTLKLFCET